MRKADRLFQVVNLIRTHQPITAQRLAQRLGVSTRTIYRYVDDLSLSGIPIYGEAGVGYALDEHFELPPLALNRDELDALLLGVELLSRTVGDEMADAARSLLSKIQAVVPEHALDPQSAPVRAFVSPFTPEQLRHWDSLRRAIGEQAAVRIDYLSLDDRASQRVIFPLGLFYWVGKWTVGAWCVLRGEYRDFRVDRIRNLARLADAPPAPEGLSLASYMRHRSCEAQLQEAQATDRTLSAEEA